MVKWQIGSSTVAGAFSLFFTHFGKAVPETSFVFPQLSPIKHMSGWNNNKAPKLKNCENISLLLKFMHLLHRYLRLLCRCRIVLRQIRRSFSKTSELENELTSSVTSFLVTSPELPVMITTLVVVFLKLGFTDAKACRALETVSLEIFAHRWPPVFFLYVSFFLCFFFGWFVSFLSLSCPHF